MRGYMMEWLGGRVVLDMRVELYDHLQMLSMGFFSRKQTGQIMSRVTNDIMRLQYFVADGLQQIILNLLTIPIVCIMLFAANPKLAALTLIPTPFMVARDLLVRHAHPSHLREGVAPLRRPQRGARRLHPRHPGGEVLRPGRIASRSASRPAAARSFGQELQVAKMWTTFFPALGFMTSVGIALHLRLRRRPRC